MPQSTGISRLPSHALHALVGTFLYVRIRLMDPLGFDGAWLFSPRIHTDRTWAVPRVVQERRTRPPAGARPGQLLGLGQGRAARHPLRGRAARSGQVRHLRLRQRPRRRGGPQNRLAHLRPVGGGAAGRRLAAGGVPGRGARPRVLHAQRVGHRVLPVLHLVRPAARARRPPAGPGPRHRLAGGHRADPRTRTRRRPRWRKRPTGLLPSYADCLAHYASAPGPQQGRPGLV